METLNVTASTSIQQSLIKLCEYIDIYLYVYNTLHTASHITRAIFFGGDTRKKKTEMKYTLRWTYGQVSVDYIHSSHFCGFFF